MSDDRGGKSGPADEVEPESMAPADGVPAPGPTAPEPPRHGRMPRRNGWISAAKLAASVVAVVAISGIAVAAFAAVDLVTTAVSAPTLTLANEEILEGVPDIGAMDGGLNFLLVGSDKRPADGAFGDPEEESAVLNDVTMLVHISQDHSHVEVVSFPRDMLVEVPECPDPADPNGEPLSALSAVKINTVLSYGGFNCVAATVGQLTGVTIPVGGIVEFYGVAALAEAVGGVDVCVAEQIDDDYTGIHLAAGMQSLTGMQALQFLRTRHGVGDGSDLGRISNQQVFMSALMRKLQADGTLGDPVKLYSMAKAILANMSLSSAMQNPTVLVSIARAVQDIDLSKVAFVQYPTAYTFDQSAVEPTESAGLVNAALQADQPIVLDPAATTDAEFGTGADPTTAAPPAPEDGTDEGTDETGEAGETPPPTGALPTDVTGQTAAEVRCSTANEG
ncbi:transcriptional attenuator, LytR family [Agromyces sp. CF514]|uniref:LCP family protein n=1 Tax=Agromyces sp. CF514 TaxID=1881031 RepID=UPI0008F086C2|nr:LCP family protein [Agromyces sp. CF514]SFR68722.1 transcriptional attenuator, LytR family [Agromyces sp. CF514]